MATFGFNTDLTPKVQGTNLSDMINMARGLQQYQQSEQANPLALQKARMEIEQAQKINPLEEQKKQEEVSQAKTLTKKGALGFSQDQTKIINENIGSVINDERLTDKDPQRRAVPLLEARQRVINSGVDPVMAEVMFAPMIDKAMRDKNPNAVPDMLKNIKNIQQSGIGAVGQQALQTPSLVTTPGGPATFQTGKGVLSPVQYGGQQPPPQIPPPTTPPAPPQFNQQPPQQPPQKQPAGAPQGGVTPTQMELKYPVRRAGDIRPFAPNEEYDTEQGGIYLNSMTKRQNELASTRRSLDEVISQAEKIARESTKFGGLDTATGTLGAISRTYAGIVGDPTYKQLSKDLANVQKDNIKAQGGSLDTVAGQHLEKMASGDETYPPDVLINIARRTFADVTNLDMQATAASKFSKKYGDNNINSFKRLWSANADSKVFEAMNIFETAKDPAKAKEEIDKLLGSNPKDRQQFYQKYNNIKKLTATGEL